MTREMMSDTMRNTAPASAEAGTSRRWRTPTMKRMACGMTRPTKPMEPTMETMTAVVSAAAPMRRTWTRRNEMPSDAARVMTKVKASRERMCENKVKQAPTDADTDHTTADTPNHEKQANSRNTQQR